MKRETVREQEINRWIFNMSKIHYSDETVERFGSIRDVFKKRLQFNKKEKAEHERIQ